MGQTDQSFLQDAGETALFLPDDDSTSLMATICGQYLGAGDTVLLCGPVGAGKSHFARALIRSYMGPDTEVPSPSFTLIQCYQTHDFEIWHADLYRLTNTSELSELGLDDAMGQALCLIEWPDRLDRRPANALEIALAYDGDGRRASLAGASPALRAALIAAFGT